MSEEQTLTYALRFLDMEIAGAIVWAPRHRDDVANAKRERKRVLYRLRRLRRLRRLAALESSA